MKSKDVSSLVVIAIVAAVISFILSGLLFKTPVSQTSDVPQVTAITTSFPDIYNDPVYTVFLNKNALDPTLPVRIGASNNSQPFSGSQ